MFKKQIFSLLMIFVILTIDGDEQELFKRNTPLDRAHNGNMHELQNGNLLLVYQKDDLSLHILDKELQAVGSADINKHCYDYYIIILESGGFYVYYNISDWGDETWYGQLFDEFCQPIGNMHKLCSSQDYGRIGDIIAKQLHDGSILFVWHGITQENLWQVFAQTIDHKSGFGSDHVVIADSISYIDFYQLSEQDILLLTIYPDLSSVYNLQNREIRSFGVIHTGEKEIWNVFDNSIPIQRTDDNKFMASFLRPFEDDSYYVDMYFQEFTSQFEPIGPLYKADTFLRIDPGNHDVRNRYWWLNLPQRGVMIQKDRNDTANMRDEHEYTCMFYDLKGDKIYEYPMSLYNERLYQTRYPILINEKEIVYFWQENDPYVNMFRTYVQKLDITTGQPIALYRHDGNFYDPVGIYQNRILVLTTNEDYDREIIYVPEHPQSVSLFSFESLSPRNDTVIEECRPFLKWESATSEKLVWLNEVEYRIHLSNSPDFENEQIIKVWGDTLVKTPVLEKGKTWFYKIMAKNATGENIWSDTKAFFVSHTAFDDGTSFGTTWFDPEQPNIHFDKETPVSRLHVAQNYPNPFNAETTISYSLPGEGRVTVDIFDIRGRKIVRLDGGVHFSGTVTTTWSGSNAADAPLPSGLYLYRVTFNGVDGQTFQQTKKMTLLR
jgi:hypothetical protein